MDLRTYRTGARLPAGLAVEILLETIEKGGEVAELLRKLYAAFPIEIKEAYWEILKRAVSADMQKGTEATATLAVLSLYPATLIHNTSDLIQLLIETASSPSALATASLLIYRSADDLQRWCREPAIATLRQAATAAANPQLIYALFGLIRNKKRWLEARNFVFTQAHAYSGLSRLPKPLAGSIVQLYFG